MVNLHVHYYNGNLKAFRQELDGSGGGSGGHGSGGTSKSGGQNSKSGGWVGSSSLGKGTTLSGGLGGMSSIKTDPNERDQLGRTVLHLAASSNTHQAYTFFTTLLKNQNISVNLQDYESGYTALHRAMFAGNIRAARDLLTRHDIDPEIRDSEGLTAFDLFNGTVDGTNPPQGAEGTDLYVWGVNRNFALGTGDSSDKAYPDRVNLLTQNQASGKPDPTLRFHHVGVKNVAMAKLHTAVVTTEKAGNLSLCGFGSNGRLGRSIHSQLALTPLPDLPHTIVSIALGQDHTLALTSGGYILSWGHNRFAQLGYVIDAPEGIAMSRSRDDEQVQVSPRRIVGPLKKEWVKGVTAGRMSSACWTADAVWTWGTNAGHLGYEKAANPVQILPRKVTTLTQPVIDVALSDFAMICLLDTNEVVCFHHDTNFRINFTTPRIVSDAFPFRPPQSTIRPMIERVTSCGQTFAALSSIGDVFTFQLHNPAEDISKDVRDRHVTVKPQLIWALRKSFTAVKDVALGSDGTVIICTHSGHVFVRSRVKSGSGQLKFKRIPYLQRVIKVACNESGAFAAVRVDAKPTAIVLSGRRLEEDMALLLPHNRRFEHQMTATDFDREKSGHKSEEDDDDDGSNSVHHDLIVANRICAILSRWRADDTDTLFSWSEPLLGSDVQLLVGETSIPAHQLILRLRSPVFENVLDGQKVDGITLVHGDIPSISLEACHPLVGLLLLQYVYTDEVPAVWDARVTRAIQTRYPDLALPIPQIKADLKRFAEVFGLQPLSAILDSTAKVPIPSKTLARDLSKFLSATLTTSPPSPACEVTLVLEDREVHCSSVLLRARCPFFEAMFEDEDWTRKRQIDDHGAITITMDHLRWRPMNLVFKYFHGDLEDDLFDYMHQETLDAFLDFVFEVLAAATELLLDRLVLICSRVIIRHCNTYNAASLACEAAFYQATTLKLSIFDYIVSSLESMLESGLLDDMHEDVLMELCEVIGKKQLRKLWVSRSGLLVHAAMERQKDWLALQDIPTPRLRTPWKWKPRSPVISPSDVKARHGKVVSPTPSPVLRPVDSSAAIEEMFSMDDDLHTPPSGYQTPKMGSRPMTPLESSGGSKVGPVWKPRVLESEKVDLRSIMAETAAAKTPSRPPHASPASTGKISSPSTRPANQSAMTPLSTPSKPMTAAASAQQWRKAGASPATVSSALSPGPAPMNTGSSRQQNPATGVSSAFPALGSSPVQTAQSPSMGRSSSKVITPVKLQPAPPGIQRKASGGSAWTAVSGFAPAPGLPSGSPDSKSFSLLAIQQEERKYADRSVKKTVKSFAEIQEEEQKQQRVEDAQREEQEFQKWWQDEQAKRGQNEKGQDRGKVNGHANGSTAQSGRGRGRGRGGQRRVPPQRGKGESKRPEPLAPKVVSASVGTSATNVPVGKGNPTGSHIGSAATPAFIPQHSGQT